MLYDRSGGCRAELIVSGHEAPRLALFDTDGKARVTLALCVRGQARPGAAPAQEAAPALVLDDRTTKVSAAFSASPAGSAMLQVADAGGARRAMVGVDAPGGRPVRLSGANRVERASPSLRPDDTPALNSTTPKGGRGRRWPFAGRARRA